VKVHEDNVWAGTSKGLVQFDKATGEVCGIYNRSNSILPTDNIFNVEVGPDGAIWMATQEGIYRFNGFDFQLIKSGLYTRVAFDDVGNYYAATKLEYEFCTPGYELNVFNTMGGFVTSVAYNEDGYCYTHKDRIICGGGGAGGGCSVWSFKNETVSNGVFTELPDVVFEDILLIDSSGNFWTAQDSLNYINPLTGIVESPQIDTLIPAGSSIWSLKFTDAIQDNVGNLWLASTLGVFRYDGQNFVAYKEGLLNTNVNSIDIDLAGSIYVGSSAGVYKLNEDNVFELWLVDGLINNGVSSLSSNSSGKYAFASYNGISVLENQDITAYTNQNSILPAQLPACQIYVDNTGGVLVNANGATDEVYFLSDSVWELFNPVNSDLLSDDFQILEPNNPDEIWLQYDSVSVGAVGARFLNGMFTNFTSLDSLHENTSLQPISQWSIEGYAAVKNVGGTITTYPIPTSMYDSTCVGASAINADGHGIIQIENIWCGQSLGHTLLRFNGIEWQVITGNIGLWSITNIIFRDSDVYICVSPEWYNCEAAHYKVIKPSNQIISYFLPEPNSLSPNYGPIRDGHVIISWDGAGDLWAKYYSFYGNECWGPATSVYGSSRFQLFKKVTDGNFIRYDGPYCATGSYNSYPRKMNTILQDGSGSVWLKGNLGIYSTEPIEPMLTIFEKNSDCAASAIACVTAGLEAVYQFEWSDGSDDPLRLNLDAGDYSCTVADAYGSTDEAAVDLTEGNAILAVLSFAFESDYGVADGLASVEQVTGDYPPFSYLWNTGDTMAQVENLTSAIYEVTITDAIGCTIVESFVLYDNMTLNFSQIDVACHGDHTGSINLIVNGGLPPFEIDWDGQGVGDSLSNLAAGVYSVTVSDNSIFTEELMVMITEPEPINVDDVDHEINSNNTMGNIFSNITGGTPPYEYLWNTGDIDSNLVDIPLGYYSLTVTDANGCVDSLTTLLADPIQLTAEVNNLNCNTDTTGFVDLNVLGGIPPYQYLWSTGATTSMIGGLSEGNYEVTVTDSLGFTETGDFYFSGIYELIYTVELLPEIAPGLIEVSLDLNTGAAPYDILWSSGDTTQYLTGVPPGFYSVNVSDANGCYDSIGLWLFYPLEVDLDYTETVCPGDSSGVIAVTTTGGIPPYSFDWNFSNLDTAYFDMLTIGNYFVVVTDSHTESESSSFSIDNTSYFTVEIGLTVNPAPVTYTLEAFMVGGILPFTYQWSNGDTNKTTEVFENGLYTVTVTDDLGCSYSQHYIISTVDVIEPSDIANIQIFPNPTNTNLRVHCEICDDFSLYNVDGRQIKTDLKVHGSGVYDLDVSKLPSGVYLLKLLNDENQVLMVERVVVAR